jgi:hypothetical protein
MLILAIVSGFISLLVTGLVFWQVQRESREKDEIHAEVRSEQPPGPAGPAKVDLDDPNFNATGPADQEEAQPPESAPPQLFLPCDLQDSDSRQTMPPQT